MNGDPASSTHAALTAAADPISSYSQVRIDAAGNAVVLNRSGSGSTSQTKSLGTSHVTLRIRRTSGRISLSAEGGGQTLEMGDLFVAGSRFVGLLVDRSGNDDHVGGRVASFHVTGGGGALGSDDFDCDGTSLLP